MDKIIEDVTFLKVGYRLSNRQAIMFCYANDAVFLGKDEDNLLRQLFRFFQ